MSKKTKYYTSFVMEWMNVFPWWYFSKSYKKNEHCTTWTVRLGRISFTYFKSSESFFDASRNIKNE
ncbi:MAG TPA: hypothetical protein DHV25_02610 [Candidatus Kerfeldbacteria bacterium]|nr:hypothetical protein [Candidatus Kerfeldbacteria bacterium]